MLYAACALVSDRFELNNNHRPQSLYGFLGGPLGFNFARVPNPYVSCNVILNLKLFHILGTGMFHFQCVYFLYA